MSDFDDEDLPEVPAGVLIKHRSVADAVGGGYGSAPLIVARNLDSSSPAGCDAEGGRRT